MVSQLPKIEGKEDINVGLMGGTFDPIHMGHLVTAEEARQQFNLDFVIFVPAGYPPHKGVGDVTIPEHRYLMTVLAVTNNPSFTVSRVEIDNRGSSYTINTVRFFRDYYGEKARLYFITGADAIMEILTWKHYAELLDLCIFIAASRPGYSWDRLKKTVEPVYPLILKKVHFLEIPAMAISSTFIRKRVSEGRTIKYLTPETVEQYIQKNRLYADQPKAGP